MPKGLRMYLVITLVLLFALTSLTVFSQELAENQTITYGVRYEDVGVLDPHRAPTTPQKMVVDSLFNGLVRFRPGSSNPGYIEPDLAKSWDIADDYLVWTFYLHEGVQFHHGYGELTAEDVVFSIEKAADPNRSAFASDFNFIKEIKALDRYTVEITLENPLPEVQVLGFLTDYQGGMIVSKDAVMEYGDDFGMNPVGTGPFKFEEYQSRSYVLLSRHDEYFRGKPYIEEIEYRFMPEHRSLQLAFEAGELDLIDGVNQDWWVEDVAGPGIDVYVVGPGEMGTIHMNLNQPPLDDIRVRKAIAYAIDRSELVIVRGETLAAPAYSPVPPGYYAQTDDVKRYDYNPERVQELLAEAGYPDGIHLGRVVQTEVSGMLMTMEIIHDQLARNNIDFDMQVVDHATFHAQIRDDMSSILLYMAARFPIPDPYLTQFYHSRSSVLEPTAVTNFSHYGLLIPGVDEYIEQARYEFDVEKQKELWIKAQQQIMEDLPAYPLFVDRLVFLAKDYVDLGYEFESTLNLTASINETTRILKH